MTSFTAGIQHEKICIATSASESDWIEAWNKRLSDTHGISAWLAYRWKASTARGSIWSRPYPSGGTTHELIRSQWSKTSHRPGSGDQILCSDIVRWHTKIVGPITLTWRLILINGAHWFKEWLTSKILLGSGNRWIDQRWLDHHDERLSGVTYLDDLLIIDCNCQVWIW